MRINLEGQCSTLDPFGFSLEDWSLFLMIQHWENCGMVASIKLVAYLLEVLIYKMENTCYNVTCCGELAEW